MKTTARETALQVLCTCRQGEAWSDGMLKATLRRNGLDEREAAFATRLCGGVLQNRTFLDYHLARCCTQSLRHIEPILLDILRLGAYQILFLDKIPVRAAVNEAVEMAKNHKRKNAAGFLNAILRRLAREREQLPEIVAKDTAERLSIRYSHPRWLVERLLDLLGETETEQFLTCNNEAVPTMVQLNPLKTDAVSLENEWTEAGIVWEKHPWLTGCYALKGTGNLTALPAFTEGRFMVQDAAAKLAVLMAEIQAEQVVLDVCAAPGGKSFAAGILMGNTGKILSCDIHAHKLQLMEKGAKRLGITTMETFCIDGRVFQPAWESLADVVICDVPCSGLGIIRKKPEIREKNPAELSNLPVIQRDILENACRYVKPNGILLYSTCTILPEENEGVTEDFLSAHPEFVREAFSLPNGETEAGQLTLWPQRHATDGFYICRMRKIESHD